MMHPDAYHTITRESQGDFRDRGSKFPSVLFHCPDEDTLKARIEQLKKEHPQARHFCYGAVIGSKDPIERSNDDGEPSGTAGLPILNQLLSADLKNTACVVVRYFGGTKLGKPGLINAYKESATDAIAQAKIVTQYHRSLLRFVFDYDATGAVMQALDKIEHSSIADQVYAQRCTLDAWIPDSQLKGSVHLFDHTDEVEVSIPDPVAGN
jgi:uncharacterized YigZ family protein